MTVSKLNTKQIIELKALAAHGEGGTYWPQKDADKFHKLGATELGAVNTEDGTQQIRVSADGLAYLADLESPDVNKGVDTDSSSVDNGDQSGVVAKTKTEGVNTMSSYEIEDSVAVPKSSRRTRTSAFPFDKLEVGQSFFVAATEARPDPAKSLASTVNGANARFSEVVEGETRTNRKGNSVAVTKQLRKFIVRQDTKDGVAGARVFRVELDAE